MISIFEIEEEKNWSKKPTEEATFHPKAGIFKSGSSDEIVNYLRSKSDIGTAIKRLTFYINRAGKHLSQEDRNRLESAKQKLQANNN